MVSDQQNAETKKLGWQGVTGEPKKETSRLDNSKMLTVLPLKLCSPMSPHSASEKLKQQLQVQNAEVEKRRGEVLADLAEAEPAIEEAQKSVRSIKKQQVGNPGAILLVMLPVAPP